MNFSPMVKNYGIITNIVPEFRYDGKTDFKTWQKEARAKLSELIGIHKFEKCDPQFNIEYKTETDEYTEYRFTIQSEENYYFPSVLRVPRGATGKQPVMICLQGHTNGFHVSLGKPIYDEDVEDIKEGDRDFCVRAIKEGYCTVAVEMRNFGECMGKPGPGTNCYESSMRAIMTGRTTVGERVWDIMRVIDALIEHFDIIDPNRICLMGNSGGGTATYYAACLEERICLAVPSCAVCSWDQSIAVKRHCACNYVPYIANYFDMGDMGGMIAPRKLIVVHGVTDVGFYKPGVDKSYDLIAKSYEVAGCPDNCYLVTGPEGHRFYADLSWPVVHKMMND